MSPATFEHIRALLIDLDGVLYVEEESIPGAAEALQRFRERGLALRFVTNTTAHSRERTLEKLARLQLAVGRDELVTPAALAVQHCVRRGHRRVALVMNDEVKRDFAELEETTEHADAVIIGDLGAAFGYDVLNHAFRHVMDGAELIALQKNRYWMRSDGLSLDVGPFVAAIEFATGREAYVVGKPAQGFFAQVLASADVDAGAAAMIGDDIESDIGGALRAGLDAVLVRTGKYREDRVRESGIQPTLVVDSIADVPRRLFPARSNLDVPAGGSAPRLTLPHGDPVAVELTSLIHGGDLDALRRRLAERPDLASVRMIGREGPEGGWRTPLHAAADWPGYFPAAPATVVLLLEAGADPNDDTGGDRPETPLHWAASTDDLEVAVALIDGGADLEVPGGSIGTPLDNAIGYSCWHVARLLVARGAKVDRLWHAAALGMVERMEHLLGEWKDGAGEVSQAFWHACAAGQRRSAEYLLARGADLNWVPEYAAGTPLDVARTLGTRKENVVSWLQERGAISAERPE